MGGYQSGNTVTGEIEITDGVDTALVSATGRLLVETQGGVGGTSAVDDSAFTPAVDSVTPAGAIYRSARDSVNDGDVGAVAMTQVRGLLVALETPAGDSAMDEVNDAVRVNVVAGSGSGTEYVEDAIAPANPQSPGVSLVRQDTPAALTTTDGDIVTQRGTNYGAAYSQIVSSTGSFIDSFGGGTQYTEDVASAVDPIGNQTIARRRDSLSAETTTDGDNTALNCTSKGELYVKHIDAIPVTDNAGSLTIDGSVTANAGTNLNTSALNLEATQASVLTAVQLIDDTVVTLGTDTYTEATSKGQTVGAVRRDADTTLVNTTNEWGPLQMDANGRLKVEVFDGGDSHTVDGTVSVTGVSTLAEQQTQTTALQLIDDIVYTDDTSTHATGTSKGALFMAAAVPTDTAVNANDIGAVAMTTDRKLHVAVMDALPAGTNGIGKLTANNGVDIGDVDVASVIPGTGATNLGKAEDGGHTSGDVGVQMLGVRTDTPNAARADTDLDYTPIATYRTGAIRTALCEEDFAALGSNHVKKYFTNAGAVTDGIVWSPAAGKRWYVTDIFINVSAAATITLEDDLIAGDSAVWKAELAANSGWSHSFKTPLFSGEDAADLLITTSAGNVYVTVTGYEI